MKSISVVLATYNEQENLGKTLESVKGWADEIVIVDGSSNDRTVEIAKDFNSKVKVVPNQEIFHINKQIAIDMATSDWVLQLDADEHVSEALKEEIDGVINDNRRKENGYWIPRKNFFLGRFLMKGGQYPDHTLRLYKKGKGKLPQKDVHEQAVVDGKIGYLKNPLLHYPYKDFGVYLQKWERYNHIFAGQIRRRMRQRVFILKLYSIPEFFIIMPVYWFVLTYIRHKGFMDSWQGLIFSLFSSLRYPFSYIISFSKDQY